MSPRTDLDFERFRRRLLEMEEALKRRIDAVASDTRALADSADGAEDSEEAATLETLNENDQALLNNLNRQLEEVRTALKKIAEGSYGICERSGRPIPTELLEADPTLRILPEDAAE